MTAKVKKAKPATVTIRPVDDGMKRQWLQCRKCKRVYYYDYVPYGLSSGIVYLPCGDDYGHRSIFDVCDKITAAVGKPLLIKQIRKQRAAAPTNT